MSSPLWSHGIKLKFADKRRVELHNSIQPWLVMGEAYSVETKLDPEHPKELPIYAEAIKELPIRDWGVLIGEFCHDLRSALDHLVWSLAEMKHEPPQHTPSGTGIRRNPWRSLYFPIWRVPGPYFVEDGPRAKPKIGRFPRKVRLIRWKDKPPPGLKWGISSALIDKIEGYQPFRRGKDALRHPLAVLQELSNIDKHRHMHLLLQTAEFYMIAHEWPLAQRPSMFMRMTRASAPRVGEGSQEVARLIRSDNNAFTQSDLKDKPRYLFDVQFGKGPPAYGGQIMTTLKELYDAVEVILLDFESEFS